MRNFWITASILVATVSIGFSQVILLSEDFETGSLPVGWARSQSTPSVGWEFGSDLGSQFFPIPNHTQYAASNDDAHDANGGTTNLADADFLITPVMNLTPYSGRAVYLEFDYIQPTTYGSVGTVEVTTNGGGTWAVVATVPPVAGEWSTISVDISAYTGSSTVQVGFHHNDNGQWADGFGVDDVEVYVAPPLDASLDELTIPKILLAGSVFLEGVITNRGSTTITSITVQYQIDGGSVQSATFDPINVPQAGTFYFVHPVPADLSAPDFYQVDIWVEDVNGVADGDSSNDAITAQISTLSAIPEKRVILEMFSGAWCQFCPDGFVRLAELLAADERFIGVVVHNGDAMEIPDAADLYNTYIGGYPSGLVDRFKFADEPDVEVNRGNWMARATERLDAIVPVAVTITEKSFEPVTREIGVTVEANFVGPVTGDFRFNCLVVEDPVVGAGSGYDQVNFYNTQAGHPYFGAGNPIIGFEQAHTVREMLGGTWGTAGAIPAVVDDGDVYSKSYTYTLPPDFNTDNISLVCSVSNYDADPENRELLNADQVPLTIVFEDGFESGNTLQWSSADH